MTAYIDRIRFDEHRDGSVDNIILVVKDTNPVVVRDDIELSIPNQHQVRSFLDLVTDISSDRDHVIRALKERLVDAVAKSEYLVQSPISILQKVPWEQVTGDERVRWREMATTILHHTAPEDFPTPVHEPHQKVSFRYDEAVSPRQAQVDMLREHLVDQVAENRYISSVPLKILLKKPWDSLRMDEQWVWRQAAEEHVRGPLSNLPRITSPQDIGGCYDSG